MVKAFSHDVFIPLGPGSCEEVKFRVLQFIKETEDIVLASNSSWFPLGESFLAAKGILLTDEELSLPQLSPSRATFSEKFLSGGDYAIRLAAQSSESPVLLVSWSISLGKQGLEFVALQSSELWPWFSQAGGSLGKKRQGGFVSQAKLEWCTPLHCIPESAGTATWARVPMPHIEDGAHSPAGSHTHLLEREGPPPEMLVACSEASLHFHWGQRRGTFITKKRAGFGHLPRVVSAKSDGGSREQGLLPAYDRDTLGGPTAL